MKQKINLHGYRIIVQVKKAVRVTQNRIILDLH